MKNRNKKASLTLLAATAALVVPFTFGCAGNTPAAAQTEPAEPGTVTEASASEATASGETASDEVTPEASQNEESQVGMANPWVEITGDEAKALCPRLFKVPEGGDVLAWLKCDELGDPGENLGSLVQLSFELDDLNYTARAQYGADEDADISGLYVDWTSGPDDVTLANWGAGHMSGKTYRSISDDGYVDLITWYDVEIGIKYSLSVAAEDLDGFDIQAIAEQMYCAENEPDTGE